jgi:serine phosphatase RsbU (regulator of sigma subunit)
METTLGYPQYRLAAGIIYSREARGRRGAGDLIDVFTSSGNRANIVMANLCGLETEVAGHARYLRHVVRTLADLHSPGSLLECLNLALNRRVADYGNDCVTSLFLAALQGGCLTYASGGHDLALLVRANGRHRRLPLSGKALGISVVQRFKQKSVAVAPGDWLLLATGGITHARDARDVTFGANGIVRSALAAINAGVDDPAASILAAARAHGSGALIDDASVLCVCFS